MIRGVMTWYSLGLVSLWNTPGLGACVQAGKAIVVILTQEYKLINVIKPKLYI